MSGEEQEGETYNPQIVKQELARISSTSSSLVLSPIDRTCILLVLSNCDFVNGKVSSLMTSVNTIMDTPHELAPRPTVTSAVWMSCNNPMVGPVKNPKGPDLEAAVSMASPPVVVTASTTADVTASVSKSAKENDDDANAKASCRD